MNGNFTLPDLDVVNDRLEGYDDPDLVSLPVLHLRYNRLRDDAVSQNLLRIQNEQVYDVAGRSQSPYETRTVFAASPSQSVSETGSAQFILRPELFFTNTGKTLSSTRVDFGDGAGYVAVGWNTPINVLYGTVGNKTIKLRLQYTDGTVAESQSAFGVSRIAFASRYGTNPRDIQNFDANGNHSGGRAFIQYQRNRQNTRQIVKPLIVVEGFDVSHLRSFRNQGSTFEDFVRVISNTGAFELNFNLDDIAGYDLIYLDYNIGTDDIRRNAALFQEVLDWVNDRKVPNASGQIEQNVVLGQSMGGLVARFGLADLARQGINTQTRLLITQDSPHRGANVPLGFQALANELVDFRVAGIPLRGLVPPLRDLRRLTGAAATRQLLIVQDGGVNTFLDGEYRQMVDRPIPGCRIVATSNGSECGNGQLVPPYGELLRVKANAYVNGLVALALSPVISTVLGVRFFQRSDGTWQDGVQAAALATVAQIGIVALYPFYNKNWKVDVVVNALPSFQNLRVFYGKLTAEKRILFVIPVNVPLWERNRFSGANTLAWDSAPGGFYNIGAFRQSLPGNPNLNAYPIVSANLEVNIADNFSFVPTPSALDITNFNVPSLSASYVGGVSVGNPSRFGTFIAAEPAQALINTVPQNIANQEHISFTARSSQWMYNEMEGLNNAAQVCNRPCQPSGFLITGNFPENQCGTVEATFTVPAVGNGVSYNWTVNNSGLQILSGQGTTSVRIRRNGSCSSCTVSASYSGGACGTVTTTSPINGGGGYSSSDYPVSGPSSAGCNQLVYYNTVELAGATSYNWFWPSDWTYDSGQGTRYLAVRTGSTSGAVGVRVANACDQGGSPATQYTQVACSSYLYAVYPNPASDYVEVVPDQTVEGNPAKDKDFEVEVYDNFAQKKLSAKTKPENKGKKLTLDVTSLPVGIYVLHIIHPDGRVQKSMEIMR